MFENLCNLQLFLKGIGTTGVFGVITKGGETQKKCPTQIRRRVKVVKYLKNWREMAEELFSGEITSFNYFRSPPNKR